MRKNVKTICLMYSFFLAIFPILHLYKSGVSVITTGEVGLIVFSIITVVLLLVKRTKIFFGKNKINTWPVIFFIVIFALTCISILIIGNGPVSLVDIFNRFIRLALWAFSISFIGYFLFDYEYTKKWIIRISIIATIYIIAQYVFWQVFNIYLPSVINNTFIQPASEGYANTDRLIDYYTTHFVRPPSFFGEPAYYSYYTLVGLVLALFHHKNKGRKNKYIIPLFISVGILISTSTAGIYLMVLVWGYYAYKKTRDSNVIVKAIRIGFMLIPAVFVLFFLFYFKSNTSDFISRLGVVLSKPFNFEVTSRLGGSYDLFNYLDGIQRLIGVGFGNENIFLELDSIYYNSITVLLLSAGYVGIIVFALFALKLLRRKVPFAFILATIYVLLCFSSSILYSSFSVVYLTIILYANNRQRASRWSQQ